MLYILPPPRAPNPPSPWDSILCAAGNSSGNDRPPWPSRRPPPRVRFRSLNIKIEDSCGGATGDEVDTGRSSKSLSECYFAGKGTALVLPAAEAQKSSRRPGADNGSNIQKHLQSMFYLLRPEETLKMAVKLESVHPARTRYLVVVSRMGTRAEESCLLGIDCNEKTTVGLVLRVLADTSITLDGDGGFSVGVCGRHHIFKPVSVQAMWSALQTLHKVSSKAREENYFQGGLTHSWVSYYEDRIESDRSCLNEWHAMDSLESRRPPSPDSVRTKPTEREETEKVIRSTLKEIMMSVDLDEVTSKYIRSRLEEELDMDLGEYKSFIDEEMLIILGQMDAPTEIFDHVYLGSEWNASNYEELQKNGVGHILNVTREIDNFFPGNFDYLNVRVYDDEKTDLLKHWDDTFKYISKARMEGSKVLVHCKMGISRSASVVIAYAMKAYNWDFKTAMRHVKEKRSCIKPNTSFLTQLETYQGILDAMKNKEKLQRSKSENNLKSPGLVAKNERVLVGSEPTPLVQAFSRKLQTMSGQDLRQLGARPKSWSPDVTTSANLLESKTPPVSRSLENLNQSAALQSLQLLDKSLVKDLLARNVLLPCDNGESYSVSPNQIMHLPGQRDSDHVPASVKERVNELESQKDKSAVKKKLVLNLLRQFDNATEDAIKSDEVSEQSAVEAQTKQPPPMLRAVLVKKEIWDPGEKQTNKISYCNGTTDNACDFQRSDSEGQTVWSSTAVLKTDDIVPNNSCDVNNELATTNNNIVPEEKTLPARKEDDPFSNQLDKVFDREERKHQRISVTPTVPTNVVEIPSGEISRESPSRQNSWSSYDSAVVLGYPGETRQTPSRHSSWGSGDTRTLPSRNSSWGSYDMRPGASVFYINEKGEKVLHPSCSDLIDSSSSGMFPYDKEDIPWYPGTVKRTKQKLEESSSKKTDGDQVGDSSDKNDELSRSDNIVEAINTVLIKDNNVQKAVNKNSNVSSAISAEIEIKRNKKPMITSRLSASAPETSSMELASYECSLSRSASNVSSIGKVTRDPSSSNIISTAQCSSVKQHKRFLENLYKDSRNGQRKPFIPEDLNDEQNTNISGIVRNLKKEFEAKTNTHPETDANKNKVNSLPSSPVSLHAEKDKKGDASPTSSDPGEDLNLKKLIGKFEEKNGATDVPVVLRPKVVVTAKPFSKNSRHSCFEVSVEKNRTTPVIQNYKSSIVEKNVDDDYKRPPMSPTSNVVVATVIATAAVKKQQQFGKSHPLARLNIRPRHNSPVYNTM